MGMKALLVPIKLQYLCGYTCARVCSVFSCPPSSANTRPSCTAGDLGAALGCAGSVPGAGADPTSPGRVVFHPTVLLLLYYMVSCLPA